MSEPRGVRAPDVGDGGTACTGSVDGSVYMLELCDGLSQIQQNEKSSVNQMLERESKREKNLETRAKELRQKERKAAEASAQVGESTEPWEDKVKKLEEDFWSIVNAGQENEPANEAAAAS